LWVEVGRTNLQGMPLRKMVLQHNRLLLLIQIDKPPSFFHSQALVIKVIIVTKFTRKLHFPFLILSPLIIFIRLFIITPTTFLSLAFSFVSELSRTLQSIRLHKMYIRRLGGWGGRASGWNNRRLLDNKFLHLASGQICSF
jgi:hypothetical protein